MRTVLRRARQHTLSSRSSNCGRARQEQRTDHELDDAPLQAQLLEVLEEPCRPVVDTGARLARLWTCVTKFEPNIENERVGQVMSRERGALGVAVRVRRATHPHQRPVTRSHQPGRLEAGADRLDCGRCPKCYSSAVVPSVSVQGWAHGGATSAEPVRPARRTASPRFQAAARAAVG